MRLKPIENPDNLYVKIAFWFSKWKFGKVIMPMKVIYARKPQLLFMANKIYQLQEKSISLDESLRILIQTQVSALNGCAFCNDLSLAQAIQKKLGTEKFAALGENTDEKTKAFTEKERSVIRFLKEYAENRKVTEDTFEGLRQNFNETEIIEILAMNAFEQYFNAFGVPLEIESDNLQSLARKKHG